jgi:hypothetical protein
MLFYGLFFLGAGFAGLMGWFELKRRFGKTEWALGGRGWWE